MTIRPRFKPCFLPVLLMLIGLAGCSTPDADPAAVTVYHTGEGPYPVYRIPVAIATPEGHLLAFAEGRTAGLGDAGDIDVVLRRSEDGGTTWGPIQIVCDDGPHTCGNPAPVVDRRTGIIHLLMTRNLGTDREAAIITGTSEDVRRVWYTRSADGGRSWEAPRDISDQARRPEWRWYATGPVAGIQLEQAPHAGRLVIPANHSTPVAERDPAAYRSHILFSDDGGATWQIGGVAAPFTNESTVAQLSDGRLMLNMRSYHGRHARAVATSSDAGVTWSDIRLDTVLVEPVCQASLLRLTRPDGGVLLFSNPASRSRDSMTVRASLDDGATWRTCRLVDAGMAAYSSLVAVDSATVGLLYERDDYASIVFARLELGSFIAP
ncbi:MAG: sialidase family protein [Rhodothermales bacterium]